MTKVRVRGIYATALTKIMLEDGYDIVQATDTILSRFNILHSTEPPDVTIKDDENIPGALFIIGKCSEVNKVLESILRRVGDVAYNKPPVPLYSVIMGVVADNGHIEVAPGVLALLEGSNYFRPGDKLPVTMVNVTGQLRASPYIMPTTSYLRVIDSPTVRLSRHIKDPDAKMMLVRVGLSKINQLGGLGIRWRSSAQYLSEEDAEKALDEAISLVNAIRVKIAEARDYDMLFEGECIVSVILDAEARWVLDDIRNTIVPTVKGHHALKITMKNTEILDYTEYLVGELKMRDELGRALANYALSNLSTINVHHVKVNGEHINLGPGERVHYSNGLLIIRRELKPGGTLDGLNVAKEYGDAAYSVINIGERHLTHIYVSHDGSFKGAYVNINTPIEVTWDGVIYIDLEVDLTVDKGFNVNIIDEDKLSSIPSRRLINEAEEELSRLKGDVVNLVRNHIDTLSKLGLSIHYQGP
ncbi:DUF402 domain-containing protein [Caldivirga maquilingensis]|uniref:Probable ribonuclease FAU-1 n=1 Tax=Caldivirga maquilingensis (strain ATCC 700844 / DSM 13496 / JCM 10307 / IC-167) TaxID=397948 RepID=FAU1_CALMQ|nr:DUF402 domain-containing protein [Caldivirga maquilingensis]A8M8Y9.1 RecName: Full=Probable ribonuclease FAU-1; AltName: Full=RNA-binding protein FAU-1 [Caldivirga maquilingensis IC-167]ABW02208.1 protein of unknown function DUF402 [Caldivirga maquilingensis IC-167]